MESILPASPPSVSLAPTPASCVASFQAVYWRITQRSYGRTDWISWKLGIFVSLWNVFSMSYHSYRMSNKHFIEWLQLTPDNKVDLELWTSSVQFKFSRSVVSDSLRPHGPQHARPPCPSPTPGAHSSSCPLNPWCHPTISSSVVPFSSCLQSCPASGSFPRSQFFAWGGQITGVSASASVLPMNIRDWFSLGCTGWNSLQSKGLSRVFSNTTVQKHQFFSAQLSLEFSSHIHTWLPEKP